MQDLCCVVDALATLNQVGFSHHVHACLNSSRNQLQHRFEQGADVSLPTLCEVRTSVHMS